MGAIHGQPAERDAEREVDGAPGSSVGRAPDSKSRGPGIETRARHLVVGSEATQPGLSEGRCARGDRTTGTVVT